MGLVQAKSCSPKLFLDEHGEVLLGRDCSGAICVLSSLVEVEESLVAWIWGG